MSVKFLRAWLTDSAVYGWDLAFILQFNSDCSGAGLFAWFDLHGQWGKACEQACGQWAGQVGRHVGRADTHVGSGQGRWVGR